MKKNQDIKAKLYQIVFEAETPAGKLFDILIMAAIIISIVITIIESLPSVHGNYKMMLNIAEYALTFFFSIEYLLRLYCAPRPSRYAFSFFGIIDLLATLPLYLTFILPEARFMLILRSFRLIRVFRIFKLFSFLNEGILLMQSLRMSLRKILVYFLFVILLVITIGTLMFMIEGNIPGTGFTDIPSSIYWAIVTLTTVGYGDITPVTAIGRFLSGFVMILGYTIIAVPTGIISANMIDETKRKGKNGRCPRCNEKTDLDANYCKNCGERL